MTRDIIISYYRRSRVDYFTLYAQLYIAYNAWYRKVTHASNDREALRLLGDRFVIWKDYLERRAMYALDMYIDRIVDLTEKQSILQQEFWQGSVKNRDDWRGLINFWYRVRCELIHGSLSPSASNHIEYVRLAYISLSIFMDEVIRRMNITVGDKEIRRIDELRILARHQVLDERQKAEQDRLMWRFIHAPPRWREDMTRMSENTLYSKVKTGYNYPYTP